MHNHSPRLHIARRLILPTILAALSACGGGGGGGAPAATPQGLPDSASQPASTQALSVSLTDAGNWYATRPVTLTLTATTDPKASITATAWNYGDGLSGSSASHTYSQAGTYTVTVTVTDSLQRSRSAQRAVTVQAMPAAPTISLTNIGGAFSTFPANFKPVVTNDAAAPIVKTTWDYGDGLQGTTADHTYSQPGTYTYTVTVTDTFGRQTSAQGTVNVAPVPAAPTVSVGTGSTDLAIYQPVRFAVAGTLGAGTQVVSRNWDYGDGQVGNVDGHTYTKPGSYTATFTVTDSLGRQASASLKLRLKQCSNAGLLATLSSSSTQSTVCVQTSMGEMVFEIDGENAPISAANFMGYVEAKFYEGLVFHRVIKDFVAQAGGFDLSLTQRTPLFAPITLETSPSSLPNVRYSLAMARTNVFNSGTSQFYINLKDNSFLNYQSSTSPGYAVFGRVISGFSVADQMGLVSTQTTNAPAGILTDVPVTPIVIYGMTTLTSP